MKIINYKKGMQITENCIVRGMPNKVYHGIPDSFSSSYGKEIYWGTIYSANKKREDDGKKKHFEVGGCFHDLVEGFTAGYDVMGRYFIYPEYKKSAKQPCIDLIKFAFGKYGGLSIDDLAEKEIELKGLKLDVLKTMAEMAINQFSDGKTKLMDTDLGQAESMFEAMKDHPEALKILNLDGESELSFFYFQDVKVENKTIKILLKVRCDFFFEDEADIFIPDWKSSAFIPTDYEIRKQQKKFGYDFSAAMYIDVVNKFFNKKIHFFNVFTCSTDPCKENVSVVKFRDEDLIRPFNQYKEALLKYADWKLNDGWIGCRRDEEAGFIEVPLYNDYD